MVTWYKLVGKVAVATDDPRQALAGNRRVARDEIGEVVVSTVFLGLDHGLDGTTQIFETMIFGGALDQEMWRYSSWFDAKQGHKAAVALVRASAAP